MTLQPHDPHETPPTLHFELLPELPMPGEDEVEYTILPSGDVELRHAHIEGWYGVQVNDIQIQPITEEPEHDYFGRRNVDEDWILPMPEKEDTSAILFTIPSSEVDRVMTRPQHLYRSRVRVRAMVSGMVSDDTSVWSEASYWRLRIPRPTIPRGN